MTCSKEVWKPIVGYKGLYYVSNLGNIMSCRHRKNGRLLKPWKDAHGYHNVTLCKNNSKINKSVHRLVAKAFIKNPKRLQTVNHIDGNKANNNINNLEWLTFADNIRHAINSGLYKQNAPKKIYCIELKRYFCSSNQASRELKINQSNISQCCRGNKQTAGGYHWKFVKEEK